MMARPVVVIGITRKGVICAFLGLIVVGLMATSFGRWRDFRPTSGLLRERISGRLIVIDPGHGGYDPGAVSVHGALEKDIVLAIAEHLGRLLNQASIYTLFTRDGDNIKHPIPNGGLINRKRQDLIGRVDMANKAEADLFISIHCNSFPQSIWSGAQVFFYPGREESKRLAIAIQTELVKRLGPNRRQANAGDYRVLKDTRMPAVMVEVGFLSNPKEAKLLVDPTYQERVANSIYHGILRYYQSSNILRR